MKKVIILFLLMNIRIFAGVTISTTNNNPLLEKSFVLKVELDRSTKIPYTIEGINEFKVISSTESLITKTINNREVKVHQESYVLLPIKTGKFKLRVRTNDKVSNSLNIFVSSPEEMKVNEKTDNINSDIAISEKVAEMFIMIEPKYREPQKNQKYYVGEKFLYNEEIISEYELEDIKYLKKRNLDDLVITVFENEKDKLYEEEYMLANGTEVIKYNLLKGVAYSKTQGNKKIVTGDIAFKVGESYSNKIGNEGKKIGASETIKGINSVIKILPLPNNKPKNFRNVVGDLKSKHVWGKKEIRTNEKVVLTINLFGNVNLDELSKIITETDPNFDIVQEIELINEKIVGNNYYIEKIYKIKFVPKRTGEMYTPQIKIPYFDIEKNKFLMIIIPNTKITVTENVINKNNDIEAERDKADNSIGEDLEKTKKSFRNFLKDNVNDILKLYLNDSRMIALFIIQNSIILILVIILIFKYFSNRKK